MAFLSVKQRVIDHGIDDEKIKHTDVGEKNQSLYRMVAQKNCLVNNGKLAAHT